MTNDSKQKIGAGHAEAMFRQGLKELRGALYPDSNVAQPPEYGLYGTQTPGEVADARRDKDADPQRQPMVDRYVRQAEATPPRERNGKEMEHDLGP